MNEFVELLKDRIFCKQCTLKMYLYLKFGILKALHADTSSLEIFQGLFALATGLIISLPQYFMLGNTLGQLIGFQVLPYYVWASFFIGVGIAKILGPMYFSNRFRKNTSLVALYLWLCVLSVFFKRSEQLPPGTTAYAILSISSIYTYLSLWRYRWI